MYDRFLNSNKLKKHVSSHVRPRVKFKKKQNDALILLDRGESIFLTGPGGVGKTAVLKSFIANSNKRVAVTSTTGASAVILNGSTLHSFLGIGHGRKSVSVLVKRIMTHNWLKNRWCQVECLIIDEISMMHPSLFDKLEQIARTVRKSSRPFGGIQLIISGDFLQLPCPGTMDLCFQANTWNICVPNVVYLNEIIRQGDQVFRDCLNHVRMGNLTSSTRDILNSRVGVILNNDYGISPTKLYAHNINVDNENNIELNKLAEDDRDFYVYEMAFEIKSSFESRQEFLINKFISYCPIGQRIELCVGAQVMLTKNIDPSSGLSNGSRGIVVKFISDMPVVRFLNGVERTIFMEVWSMDDKGIKILQAHQLPLCVAYAMSIHKSQGGSLDYAEIDLSDIFDYGQAYVALSRVKTLEGLSIIAINYDYIKADPLAVKYYENIIEKT